MTPDDAELDQLPRRSKLPLLIVAVVLVAGGVAGYVLNRPPPPDPPERELFRRLLPAWQIARSRADPQAAEALRACVAAAKPWPEVAKALEALEPAWSARDPLTKASAELNRALRAAALAYWVDPQFIDGKPVLTTYDLLGRARWKSPDSETEVVHVRRLDRLNIQLAALGHASGDQPAVLRDRVEVSVVEKLCTLERDDEEDAQPLDDAAALLWREQLGALVGADGLAEAERRLNRREQLMRAMERRLGGGETRVARPERLVYGDAYFDALEPYTSTRRRGGPAILASDLRTLRHADQALDGSDGLIALVAAIEHESQAVEAHEAHHALDRRELPVPALLQRLVGEDDPQFGKYAERELRAFLGELHDAKTPACLSVVNLALQARGRNSASTPHFFAAHAILSVLGEVPGERGVSERQAREVMQAMCALPDAELRKRAAAAAVTLYAEPLRVAVPVP